ncbi:MULTISPECIES: 50S ribosomal protein L18Ae [Acidianus]|uniref:Large ribosomal subunit protein eL20 n=1 Tax=Candidatus Acidianus copahuensis TaxID=1160895 RepID=A0A031LPJ3_9CREN|nr:MULTISPECIES: 50S ribosomal protein L18Ae [Acidianus]EZQ06906.1 50S ribosomal protein LX [Candidatus Acidianus copahuensis]NON61402.1 50S ribosomal protein L18a [Acidianus sp. RZ1]
MTEVKFYLVRGTALFNESNFPTPQKFTKYVRALNENQAKEYVYNTLGTKNKIKRGNIRIEEIKEVSPEEVKDRKVKEMEKITKIIM